MENSKQTSLDLLPEKSRKNYEIVYNTFIEWRQINNTTSFLEDTVLAYFKEISRKYKASTLWTHYSMLKSTLKIKHNIDIETYSKVHALLKRQSEGYQPRKSESFTGEEIRRFIKEAPDVKYLATKVALTMGIMGECRSAELHAMRLEDIRYFDGYIQVFVLHTKPEARRNFKITGGFYHLVKKYADLRPPNTPSDSFFLNFQNGKCTTQIIGINKFGSMGKEIAKFLGISNPERYTGHCLRRASAALKMTTLKRHMAQEYNNMTDFMENGLEVDGNDLEQINTGALADPCTSSYIINDSNKPNIEAPTPKQYSPEIVTIKSEILDIFKEEIETKPTILSDQLWVESLTPFLPSSSWIYQKIDNTILLAELEVAPNNVVMKKKIVLQDHNFSCYIYENCVDQRLIYNHPVSNITELEHFLKEFDKLVVCRGSVQRHRNCVLILNEGNNEMCEMCKGH